MRSGVGTFCPRSRRPDLREVLFPCALPPALEEAAAFCGAALSACAEPANTPAPAAASSVRARCVAFRTRMGCLCWLFLVLLLIVRRNSARQVKCQNSVAVLPAKNLEHHVLARLEF